MANPTLILSAADVRSILSMKDAVRAVELAFAEHASGNAQMPPKVYLSLPAYRGDFRAMPAFIGASTDAGPDGAAVPARWPAAAGIKWVNSHPENPTRHGLPSVMGVYILSDPATAVPLAVLDATVLTAARTGAAAAVASSYLAKAGPTTLGFVGCGVQARWMLDAHRVIYGEALRVVASDVRPDAAEDFARYAGGVVDSIEAAAGCDIVCSSTPGRSPVIAREWLRPGAHVNAMGADAPGKQELDPAILDDAIVVVDERYQATHSGEINVPLGQGRFSEDRIFATIGEVVIGARPLARGPDTITVFDSTGLAIQDVALARVLYATAKERGVGTPFDLLG